MDTHPNTTESQKRKSRFFEQAVAAAISVCMVGAAIGLVLALYASKNTDEDTVGSYAYSKVTYMDALDSLYENVPVELPSELLNQPIALSNAYWLIQSNEPSAAYANTSDGKFVSSKDMYKFYLNGEAFSPSITFLYVVHKNNFMMLFNIDELIQILDRHGYKTKAEMLRQSIDLADTAVIARGNYVTSSDLAKLGIDVFINLAVCSHTPVHFNF